MMMVVAVVTVLLLLLPPWFTVGLLATHQLGRSCLGVVGSTSLPLKGVPMRPRSCACMYVVSCHGCRGCRYLCKRNCKVFARVGHRPAVHPEVVPYFCSGLVDYGQTCVHCERKPTAKSAVGLVDRYNLRRSSAPHRLAAHSFALAVSCGLKDPCGCWP
jgi:hypothetical protein